MAPKIIKQGGSPQVQLPKAPLGISPAGMSKRNLAKGNSWCPKSNIEFDNLCDPDNPKTITYKEIVRAANAIKDTYPETPIMLSRCSKLFEMNLYYKMESLYKTGSFHERQAFYVLQMLRPEQQQAGVITASLGNWAMALAYRGLKANVKVTVVLPTTTILQTITKCKEMKAEVVLFGETFAECKRHAFLLAAELGLNYINGYDHPSVIAAAGTIGIEIMTQLPQTDAIIVPVGGGALIAGIAEAAKHFKPDVLIYGVEPDKCCCFFKAMEKNEPYETIPAISVAESLAIPTAGYNAFYTAKSLIDKMVLVDDDWIARAVLHFAEEEKMILEGAGATSLSALLAIPTVLPELKEKTVVCVMTGSNMDIVTLPRCFERAKAIEGRLIKVTVTIPIDGTKEKLAVFNAIANVGCSVRSCYAEGAWIEENDLHTIHLSIICETNGLEHAAQLKRTMLALFPGICEFQEEALSPIPICHCYPKKRTL